MNARVWTADPRRPWADAVLVRGSVLAGVGASAEIRKRAGAGTITIDAQGWTVLPADLVPGLDAPAPPGSAGVLRAGQPATFVLLDRALVQVDADSVREGRVRLVVVAGNVVHDPHGCVPRS